MRTLYNKKSNYVEIIPIQIEKKDQKIVMPQSATNTIQHGQIVSEGDFKGKIVLFRRGQKEEHNYNGTKMFFIPLPSILTEVIIDDTYKVTIEETVKKNWNLDKTVYGVDNYDDVIQHRWNKQKGKKTFIL